MHAASEKMERLRREEFALELTKCTRGEPSNIEVQTVDEVKAKIAKELVEAGSELTKAGREMELLEEVERIHSPDDLVNVEMMISGFWSS